MISATSRGGGVTRPSQVTLLHALIGLALLANKNAHAESITRIKGLPININPLTVVVKNTQSNHALPSWSTDPPRESSHFNQHINHNTHQKKGKVAALTLLSPAERRAHEMFIKALPSMSAAYVASISDIFTRENPTRVAPLQIAPKLMQVTLVHKIDEPAGTWVLAKSANAPVPVSEGDFQAFRPLQLQVQVRDNQAKQTAPSAQAPVTNVSVGARIFAWVWAVVRSVGQVLTLAGALYWSVCNGLVKWAEGEMLSIQELCAATFTGALLAAGGIQSLSRRSARAVLEYAACVRACWMNVVASAQPVEVATPANTAIASEKVPKIVAQPAALQQVTPQQAPQVLVQPQLPAVTDVIMHSHSADVEEKVSSLENAALDMMRTGKALEAANVLQEGVDFLCRLGKEMHVDVAALRHLLVKCRLALGEAKVAESLLRKVLTVYAYACGGCTASDPYTAEALEDMSQSLSLQGRLIEARIAAAKAREIRQVLDEVQLEAAAASASHKHIPVKGMAGTSSKTPERTVSAAATTSFSRSTLSSSPPATSENVDSAADLLDLDALEKKLRGAVFDIAPAGAEPFVKQAVHTIHKSPCRTASPLRGHSHSASNRVLQNASTPTRTRRVA